MSFFKALFDFSFQSYVTNKIIKVLYVIALIVEALGAVIMLIVGLVQIGQPARLGGGPAWLLSIIFVPIAFFLIVIATRVYFELLIIIFQVAENIRDMAWALTKGQKAPTAAPTPPPAPQFPTYGQQQQYPYGQPQQPQPPQQYPQYPQYPPQTPQPPSGS